MLKLAYLAIGPGCSIAHMLGTQPTTVQTYVFSGSDVEPLVQLHIDTRAPFCPIAWL